MGDSRMSIKRYGLSNVGYDYYLDLTDAMMTIDEQELSDRQEIDAFYKAILEWVEARKAVINNRYN